MSADKDARIAELERKLAEQQALNKALPSRIADICFIAGTTEHLCVSRFWLDSLHGEKLQPLDMAIEELNNLLAKAKEEGRREAVPEVVEALAQWFEKNYSQGNVPARYIRREGVRISAAPKPEQSK